MDNKQKKVKQPYVSKISRLDNVSEPFEPEKYEDLFDEGFSDSYIASELNVNEEFLSGLKKDMQKDKDEE